MKKLREVMVLDKKGYLKLAKMKIDTDDKNWKQKEGEYPGVMISKDGKFIRIANKDGEWTYHERQYYETLDLELGCALASADGEIQRKTGKTTEEIVKNIVKRKMT